jgi:peroxiredoxin family protein
MDLDQIGMELNLNSTTYKIFNSKSNMDTNIIECEYKMDISNLDSHSKIY